MRRIILLTGLLLMCAGLWAQIRFVAPDSLVVSSGESVPTLVERINAYEPGKGHVRVIQDADVAERLGRPSASTSYSEANRVEINGWRVQVYSGNNQRLSKEESFSKEADVKSLFPELSTYVRYTAPFWRLRVGDFQTFKDANEALTRLKRAFPTYGREMSIVKETIQVVLD